MGENSVIPFWKIEGLGNHFAILFAEDVEVVGKVISYEKLSQKIGNPRNGVGTDGLMVVHGRDSMGRVRVNMYNPDGSPMGMCGNGIRCVVRHLHLTGFIEGERETTFLVDGKREVLCQSDDEGETVKVALGTYSFEKESLPATEEILNKTISVEGGSFVFDGVSVGNPHAVTVVDNVDKIDLHLIGPQVEHHQLFPKRINVEFIEIKSRDRIKMRVWERGAGETFACGTGATASAIVAFSKGLVERRVTVELPGGELQIEVDGENKRVTLEGPAREVYKGELSPRFVREL